MNELLNSATEVSPSITYVPKIQIDVESIQNELRALLLTKDKNLLKIYDIAKLSRCDSVSGIDNIKGYLMIVREFLINKHKENNTKNLTIRKNFDIIFASLECLLINDIDSSSTELNTLMMAFVSKNFI